MIRFGSFTQKDGGRITIDLRAIEAVMDNPGYEHTTIVTGSDTYRVTDSYEAVVEAWGAPKAPQA